MTQVDQNSIAHSVISNIASYLGIVPNLEDLEKTIAEAKQKIDVMREDFAREVKKNEELEKLIDEFKKDVERVTNSNSGLLELYKEVCEQDSAVVAEGRKATYVLKDLKRHIDTIAKYLKIPQKKDDPVRVVEKILDEVIKVSDIKQQLEKNLRFDSPVDPTVSQAAAAVAVKRKTFGQWTYEALQALGILK